MKYKHPLLELFVILKSLFTMVALHNYRFVVFLWDLIRQILISSVNCSRMSQKLSQCHYDFLLNNIYFTFSKLHIIFYLIILNILNIFIATPHPPSRLPPWWWWWGGGGWLAQCVIKPRGDQTTCFLSQ